ncbi:hypothetical protein GCM10007079_08570 [Nocardiopsis terrae]|uniref:Pristinamycin I synthase-2 n=1 Tax=Nocardiopsis terrae TaxID=372655 RepID=A0ABR9HD32_9ACTN|nr:non-ribosomal peptide synthetase [Nocardiopsis terrae]MBE1456925.1 pristinamycin I synthase-2 [Nocardiopsis terrae]GHC74362.1 hypothetical protein GCM10007079_08570 [Nocardiopsis terrae]
MAVEDEAGLALTSAQQGIWFACQRDPSSHVYNVGEYVDLRGPVDADLLDEALHQAVLSTEAFHTRFHTEDDGRVSQFMAAAHDPGWRPRHVDLTGQVDPVAVAEHMMRQELRTPVDPTGNEPLFEHILFRVAHDRLLWFYRVHHILLDGFGLRLFVDHVAHTYTRLLDGRGPEGDAPLPGPGRLVEAERQHRASVKAGRDRAYWRATLADRPRRVWVGEDRTADGVAHRATGYLGRSSRDRLKKAAATARTGWPTVVFAATGVYTHRLVSSFDVVLGLPVSGRTTSTARRALGTAVNVLPLRFRVRPDDTVSAFIADTHERLSEALRHQHHPLEEIRRDLGMTPEDPPPHGPVVNIMPAGHGERFGTVTGVVRPLATGPVTDLKISVYEEPGGGLRLDVEANPRLHDEAETRAHKDRIIGLLERIGWADEETPLGRFDAALPHELTEVRTDRPQGRSEGSRPDADVLPSAFERCAAALPGTIAVTDGERSLTYAELNARANRLAHKLIGLGAGPEKVVALALPRSCDLVVALLAVLKSGAAYLPLDPTQPDGRTAWTVADTRPIAVITAPGKRDVPGLAPGTARVEMEADTAHLSEMPDSDPPTRARPENAAYVIHTSGSTGRPKGVVVPHANVLRLLDEAEHSLGLAEPGVWTLFHSYAFDFSVWEIWGALARGGRLVVVPASTTRSPDDLLDLLESEEVTVLSQTPSAFYQLIGADRERRARGRARRLALRHVVLGGEALDPARLSPWFSRPGGAAAAVTNMYGITETTVHVTHGPVDPAVPAAEGPSSVGTPLGHLNVHILDTALRPVPPGCVGEMYVSGPGLARGYLDRFGLTAERFVADPFGASGTRMYRTGDLARTTSDGALVHMGRVDRQAQIRGFRVEPGEVEAHLVAVDGIAEAAVVARADGNGGERLVAYAVPEAGRTADTRRWRGDLGEHLPAHMVPSILVPVDEIPLTANGKLDRDALPGPPSPDWDATAAARTPEEELVCDAFARACGVDGFGVDDDFFVRGGHSLLAARLTIDLRRVLGTPVTVGDVFRHPTPAGLAARMRGSEALTPDEPLPLAPGTRTGDTPLSYAQRRMWLLHRMQGASPTYNMPVALRFTGELDESALAEALDDLVDRHATLRTVYPESPHGCDARVLPPDEAPLTLEHHTVTESALDEALTAAARESLDLESRPPVRAHLFRVGAADTVLLLLMHHIAGDGASLAPLVTDLTGAYTARARGREPRFAPLATEYAGFSGWQKDVLGEPDDPGSRLHEALEHWAGVLRGLSDQTELPTDRPRPASMSHRGGSVPVSLGAELHRKLADLAHEVGATVHMVLQAVLAALLTRLGAGTDVTVGCPTAGRPVRELDALVGFFVNPVVLRTDTSGDPTFRELLGRVRDVFLDAYQNQDAPFEMVVDRVRPDRSPARHPLFQVVLSHQREEAPVRVPGLSVRRVPVDLGVAKFDLTLNLVESHGRTGAPAGVDGDLEYAAELFDRETAEAIVHRLTVLMRAAVERPDGPISGVDLLTEDEERHLQAPTPATAPPDRPLTDFFEAQVARTPDTVAVEAEGVKLTYAELDRAAERLARRLSACGVGPETAVAILQRRSADLVVSLLAVLKAGGFYVPLNTRYPAARLGHLMRAAGAPVLLTDEVVNQEYASESWAGDVQVIVVDRTDAAPVDASDGPPRPRAPRHPEQLAYVMFTSGSTGVPKGVAITDRDVAVLATDRCWPGGAHERVLLNSPYSFDTSQYELWVPLLSGGTVVVAPPEDPDLDTLERLLREGAVTGMWLTSGLFNLVARERPECLRGVREVWTGGDVVAPDAVSRVLRACPDTRVVDGYGPTEATTFTTRHAMSAPWRQETTIPIGTPLDHTSCYVLGPRLEPVPTGVLGELYIGGARLARGYLDRPGSTSERFVADPFGAVGTRMYRTGDLVRRRRSGTLEFIGRIDHQVQVRGFRVELGEIESVLGAHPDVGETAVMAREDDRGEKRLVGYVVPASGARIRTDDVLREAAAALPDYMVPAMLVTLERLPLTPNGKLDRAALPAPGFAVSTGRAPRSANERLIARLFAEMLDREDIGAEDGFFDLGGDSIIAIRLVARARREGLVFSPRDVFERKTVAGLAAVATAEPGSGSGGDASAAGEAAATPIMHWLSARGGPVDGFAQSMCVRVPGGLGEDTLVRALQRLLDRHGVLRSTLTEGEDGRWGLRIAEPGRVPSRDWVRRIPAETGGVSPRDVAAESRRRLDPRSGRMGDVVWVDRGEDHLGDLVVTLHHLVVDGVSWRILLPELQEECEAVRAGRASYRPGGGTSYRAWAAHLEELAEAEETLAEMAHWTSVLSAENAPPVTAALDADLDTVGTSESLTVELAEEQTAPLLAEVPRLVHGNVNDVLLTALALAVADWRHRRGLGDADGVLIDVETHGREPGDTGLDLSRCVGWFTNLHPVLLAPGPGGRREALAGGAGLDRALKRVKEQLRQVRRGGIGYGLLRYLNEDTGPRLARLPRPDIGFNYLGRSGGSSARDWSAEPVSLALLDSADPELPLAHAVEVNAVVRDGEKGPRLTAVWSWAPRLLTSDEVADLNATWFRALRAVTTRSDHPDAGGRTPSDLPLVSMSQDEIDRFEDEWKVRK